MCTRQFCQMFTFWCIAELLIRSSNTLCSSFPAIIHTACSVQTQKHPLAMRASNASVSHGADQGDPSAKHSQHAVTPDYMISDFCPHFYLYNKQEYMQSDINSYYIQGNLISTFPKIMNYLTLLPRNWKTAEMVLWILIYTMAFHSLLLATGLTGFSYHVKSQTFALLSPSP